MLLQYLGTVGAPVEIKGVHVRHARRVVEQEGVVRQTGMMGRGVPPLTGACGGAAAIWEIAGEAVAIKRGIVPHVQPTQLVAVKAPQAILLSAVLVQEAAMGTIAVILKLVRRSNVVTRLMVAGR